MRMPEQRKAFLWSYQGGRLLDSTLKHSVEISAWARRVTVRPGCPVQ
jgi:hypothetical protein